MIQVALVDLAYHAGVGVEKPSTPEGIVLGRGGGER